MTTPAPLVGPATVTAVAAWLAVPEGHPERAHIEVAVGAVNAFVAEYRADAADPETGEFPAHIVQGANQLAARITRRRNSPAGVEAFTELGPSYVSRYDVDLDRLLGLGGYRRIVVG